MYQVKAGASTNDVLQDTKPDNDAFKVKLTKSKHFYVF